MTLDAVTGRAWVYGDDIDTDVLAPAGYLTAPLEEMAAHCLQALDPDFAGAVRPGDIFVAGDNLGIGSSREQAPQCLIALGIRAVLARSFARIFYRNALNLGLPALVCRDVDRIGAGDVLRVDPIAGTVEHLSTGQRLGCEALPAHLVPMIADGGLVPHLRRRFAKPSAC